MANMLEGGRTPMLPPAELFRLGFAMVAYPTSLIFRVARTIEQALADLKAGTLAIENEGVDFETFKDITGFGRWADIEQRSERNGRIEIAEECHAKKLAHVCNRFRRDARRRRPGAAGERQGDKPELAKVRLAVGGKPALFYLPLTVTERLRLFPRAGRRGRDFRFSGRRAGAAGAARRQRRRGDRQLRPHHPDAGQEPGDRRHHPARPVPRLRAGGAAAKAQRYREPKDLKGMKIGITAPGSGTHIMAQHFMVKNGLRTDDASFIGVGASASAVAAVQRGEIDAMVNVDPVISLLESQGLIKVIADTRTSQGTREVFGGPYPAAVLYAQRAFIEKNPRTMQALVNALLRGLKWIAGHSVQEIAALMPEEYALGNKALYIQAITKSLPMYSRDGRFSREGAETAYAVLKAFDPKSPMPRSTWRRPTRMRLSRRRWRDSSLLAARRITRSSELSLALTSAPHFDFLAVDLGRIESSGVPGSGYGALGGEPRAQVIGRERGLQLLAQPIDDGARRAGRRHQPITNGGSKIRAVRSPRWSARRARASSARGCVTASARRVSPRTWPSTGRIERNIIETWPPTRSPIAGPLPL